MRTETITTHAIKVGDRIARDMMILLVDKEPRQTNHPVHDDDRGVTLATRAVIENWDDLVAEASHGHSTAQFIVNLVRDDLHTGRITEPRWTIQGNGWARWARII